MVKRSPTTKDVALLWQLYKDDQLIVAPEFQRNNIWPPAAKAYLIDTILNERPIPLFFLQRVTSAQSGRSVYSVIDGQQRLRAIFEFLDNKLRLTQSPGKSYYNKTFARLPKALQDRILNYDLMVDELSGFREHDIKDVFIRMNRYVVKLSQQELRHAKHSGAFFKFVESLGEWDFWSKYGVFSKSQIRRMRSIEFAAELAILLIEGPQDKKSSIDLYYAKYRATFQPGNSISKRLKKYSRWIIKAAPDFSHRFIRKPIDLYSLIAAIDSLSHSGKRINRLKPRLFAASLARLEQQMKVKEPSKEAARYIVAASRQTDNIGPRLTRIEVLSKAILGEF